MSETSLIPRGSQVNRLLDRPIDNAYLQEWTALLSTEREAPVGRNVRSMVLFRIGNEWLALSTQVFAEISDVRTVRRIPHRSGDILRGLVNLRGQLCLCIDLAKMLEIEQKEIPHDHSRKMVAISKEMQRWVFVADEILGLFLCDIDSLKNVPVTVAKSTANYFRGTAEFEGRHASVLDEDLLFYSLERRIA